MATDAMQELNELLDLIEQQIDMDRCEEMDERYRRTLAWEDVDRPPLVAQPVFPYPWTLPEPWDRFRRYTYSEGFDELRKPMPYYDSLGIRVPDVYDDREAVRGIDRYRTLLAHVAAHKRWSSQIVADNYSPFQRVAIETFEDARVDRLAMAEYPGLRRFFLALHPAPGEDDCDPERESCIRHRLAMFSYAALNPDPFSKPQTRHIFELGCLAMTR